MSRIVSIQYLRAAAALMVVFFHAEGMAAEYFDVAWPSFGAVGVDIFFIISGFIMWVTTASERTTPSSFILNRIVRIVPLYWLVTLLLYGGWRIFRDPALLPPVSNLLQSLFFIPFIPERAGIIQPLLITGWTLNYEMFFYVVFACGFLIARRYRLLLIGTVLGALVASRYLVAPSSPVTMTYTSPLLIEFIVGCLLGMMYERKALPRPQMAVLLLVVGGLLLLGSGMLPASSIGGGRFVRWGLPAFLVVVGALSLEPLLKAWRVPMQLGDASYSIYLTHSVVLSTLKSAVLIVASTLPPLLAGGFVVAGCVASIAAGVLVYRFVEAPLLMWSKQAIAAARNRAASSAA
ncbi:acyltransferase family protein [Bradyrhizobium sp. SYSU BS000235]|uniref:acyltransferase family protein n=1 Tax=Bradyrhizobium sp. SYSU BS000235 TaxID=3411332 RepID=UPI003C709AB6